MNSKLAILIRNYLQIFWGSFKYNKKASKIIGSSIAIVVGGLALMAMMGFVAYGQMMSFSEAGHPEAVFFYFLMLSFLLAILTAVMRSSSSNNATDADLLLSMPLGRQTILLAKSVSKYCFELLPITAFFLPSVIIYCVIIQPGLLTLLRCLLVWLLLPLVAVGVSYILGWIFFKISDKVKNPSAITTALSMLVIFGFVGFNMFSGSSGESVDIFAFYSSMTPLTWAVDFMASGSLLGLLKFALITVGPFAVGVFLNSRIFGIKHRTWTSRKKELDFRSRSPRQALVKKELIRFFGSSGYLMNAGIGMIMSFLLTIAVIIGKNSFLAGFLGAEGMGAVLPAIFVMVYCCCAGMSYMSACMVSLEGKQLWVLKTTPVDTMDIFRAKIKANLLITLPLTVICSATSSLVLGFAPIDVLVIVVACGVFCVMAANIGLVLNLNFPRLDWKEEIQVVKQGMSVMLALFIGVLPVIAIFVSYLIFLQEFISFAVICLAAIALFLIVTLICQRWLASRGKVLWQSL